MGWDVLVVDDSSTVRAMVILALEAGGVRVNRLYQAGDGREALAILRRQWVDVMITDVNMPACDGIQLVRTLQEDPGLRLVPVVVVSSADNEENRTALRNLGVGLFISKPFNPDHLAAAVTSAVSGRQRLKELNGG